MKPAINIGQKAVAAQKQIDLLLEKGYDIYVLRLKKITEYPVTLHGFDLIKVRQHKSPNSLEVSYRLEEHRASYATFNPNEDGVATAYVPATPRNIRVVASHFYSNQIDIIEIITPNGVVPHVQALERVKSIVDSLGIKPVATDDAFSRHVNKARARQETRQAQIKASQEKTNQVKTVEEAQTRAEEAVFLKYSTMIEFMKKKSGAQWKNTGEYKSVMAPEIEAITNELCEAAGLKMETEEALTT